MQEGTDVGYLDGDNPHFLMNFTIQRLFLILACLDMTAWQGNGPGHHSFGALALLREDLTVFYEHKGDALDRTHIIHHRKTSDMLWHLTYRAQPRHATTDGQGPTSAKGRRLQRLVVPRPSVSCVIGPSIGEFSLHPCESWRQVVGNRKTSRQRFADSFGQHRTCATVTTGVFIRRSPIHANK